MKRIQLVSDFQNDEIKCPKCRSDNYIKKGKVKSQQRYKCKNCNKTFNFKAINHNKCVSSKDILPDNISPYKMKGYDIWNLKLLGKKPTTSGDYSLNFTEIHPEWLKIAVKDFLWIRSANRKSASLIDDLGRLKKISRYLEIEKVFLQPTTVNRKLILNVIHYLQIQGLEAVTIGKHISTFKVFFDFCQQNKIITKQERLIFPEDYPKRKKSKIKDIPYSVLNQLKSKLILLPKPIVLAVEIMLETGIRVSEISNLKFNCIQRDSDGDWWINVYREKLDKESRLIITKELAIKIQRQQNFIQDRLNHKFDYLFCDTKGRSWFKQYPNSSSTKKELSYFIPIAQSLHQETIRGYLHQLADDHKITDAAGEIYPIWRCHQFRHTHLTDLARKGTGIAHIMQRAGHLSPAMSMEYVHLTNDDQKKKMKEVWDNTHFNMEGEIVAPVNPDLDTAEMQWIKKGMGMQTTDNGYCTLLWTQTCPHQDLPCKGCGSWVTTLDFLDSHKQELKETEKIIENARQKGYQRQIEKNVPRADRLKKIISGMEKHASMRGLGHNEWEEKE